MTEEKNKLGGLLSKQMDNKDTGNCLSENILSEFIDKKLSSVEKDKVLAHLNECNDCFEVYKIASSLIRDNKIKIKRNLIKSFSIAASIMIVFLLGFYYSSFFKPQQENMSSDQLEALSIKSPSIKAEEILDKSYSVKENEEKDLKYTKKGKLEANFSRKKMKIEEKEGFAKPMPIYSEKVEKKSKLGGVKRKNIKNDRIRQEKSKSLNRSLPLEKNEQRVNDNIEISSRAEMKGGRVGSVVTDEDNFKTARTPEKKQLDTSKVTLYEASRKITGKKQNTSTFLILSNQGFVYNNSNTFKKIEMNKVLKLLSKWELLLPNLKGKERKIAIDTINYLYIVKKRNSNKN